MCAKCHLRWWWVGDRASVDRRKPWGEALLSHVAAALAECGAKRGHAVVVEVEGGGALDDAADLLDDVAFERDWGREDEGVESREVYAFAGDLRRGHEHDAGARW